MRAGPFRDGQGEICDGADDGQLHVRSLDLNGLQLASATVDALGGSLEARHADEPESDRLRADADHQRSDARERDLDPGAFASSRHAADGLGTELHEGKVPPPTTRTMTGSVTITSQGGPGASHAAGEALRDGRHRKPSSRDATFRATGGDCCRPILAGDQRDPGHTPVSMMASRRPVPLSTPLFGVRTGRRDFFRSSA